MLSILLLCDDRPSHAPNVEEHIRAFRRFSKHDFDLFNPRGIARSRFLRLDDYDIVVIHYSTVLYLSEWFRERIASFGGLKVQFVQDEYRQVEALTSSMRDLGIHVLFSSVPANAVQSVYGARLPGVDILPTLTGYVPADLDGVPWQPLADRPLDVVYRGRSVPYWLGRLGQDKSLIGREFLARAHSTDLQCDIAWTEADRIYGDAWYRFLGSSRTTLGHRERGLDRRLRRLAAEAYGGLPPAAPRRDVRRGRRRDPRAVRGQCGHPGRLARVFEAAALGTAMVNFPGRYSDVIEPWAHYLPLEKDFSNFEEVVEAIRDDALLVEMTSRAHSDLVASGRYSLQAFIREFDRAVEARAKPAPRRSRSNVAGGVSRKLRSLETVQSPRRLAETPLVASQRTRAAELVGRRLIRRFPEIDALAQPQPDKRLLHDLVRLAAAAAAHLRELHYLGPPFDVRLELSDGDRRLTLIGTDEQVEENPSELRERTAAAIRGRHLEEIVWDNSAVRESLKFPAIQLPSLEIGYHVVAGAHSFTALMELSVRDPDGVVAAIGPFFRSRPQAPVHEIDRRVLKVLWLLLRRG